MKSYLLILILILSFGLSYSQENPSRDVQSEMSVSNQQLENLTWPFPTTDSLYTWDWNLNTSNWDFKQRYYNAIDTAAVARTTTWQNWIGTAWINSSLQTDYYEITGRLNGQFVRMWDGQEWKNNYRNSWEFNSHNDAKYYLFELWKNDAWTNQNDRTSTYDINHHKMKDITRVWKDTAWLNVQQIIYTYNTDSLIQTITTQNWANYWKDAFRSTYTYDQAGRYDSLAGETYDVGAGWVPYNRIKYTYDSTGQIKMYTTRNYVNNEYVNKYRNTDTYDENGYELNFLREDFVDSVGWVLSTFRAYGYDDEKKYKDYYIVRQWDMAWINDDSSHYYWPKEIISSDNDPIPIQLDLFPNPVTERIYLTASSSISPTSGFNIYATNGRLMGKYRYDEAMGMGIDVSNYAPGTYFVVIRNERQTICTQIVKL